MSAKAKTKGSGTGFKKRCGFTLRYGGEMFEKFETNKLSFWKKV